MSVFALWIKPHNELISLFTCYVRRLSFSFACQIRAGQGCSLSCSLCVLLCVQVSVGVAEALTEHVFVVRMEKVRGLAPLQATVWGEADCYIQYSFPTQEDESKQQADPDIVESSEHFFF